MSRLLQALRSRISVAAPDGGMSTAEYAVGIVAACGFAAVLYHVLTSGFVEHLIEDLIVKAVHLIPGL
ncbi:MAG TPA: DUF4244 domain-containing protein [Mycobacteriales bacterium]|nr:DUF4244 domain-containing protein [Mycobacteriales bacterium]